MTFAYPISAKRTNQHGVRRSWAKNHKSAMRFWTI